VATRKPHRLSLRVEDHIVVRLSRLGHQISVTLYVLRLDHKAEDPSLTGRDEIEHFLVVVPADPHKEPQALQLGSGIARARQMDNVTAHREASFLTNFTIAD